MGKTATNRLYNATYRAVKAAISRNTLFGGFSGVASKATASIVISLFLVLICLSLYLFTSQSQEVERAVRLSATSLGNAASRNVSNWLIGKSDLAERATQQIVKGMDDRQIDKVLGSPAMTKSFILSSFGDVRGNYTKIPKGPIRPGYDARERPWFKAAVEAGASP